MRLIGFAVVLTLLAGYQVLPAEANPFHDRVIVLSDAERNKIFTAVLIDERCVVTRSFFQGFDKSGNAYWNVACTSRTPQYPDHEQCQWVYTRSGVQHASIGRPRGVLQEVLRAESLRDTIGTPRGQLLRAAVVC